MGTELHTGAVPGRIVWGHPGKMQNKTDQQNKPVIKADGTTAQVCSFGVAFPKDHFNAVISPVMAAEAATKFPNGVPPSFSWKLKDGDSVDRKGQPYNLREGYAGCMVITVSTEAFTPPLLRYDPATGQYQQMTADQIKCGDYVALVLDFVCNQPVNASHTPGLFVNPKAVIFVAYGTEIVPKTAFDPSTLPQMQYQLPAGASQTPTVPQPALGVPGAPAMGQPAMGQPAMGQPAMGQPAMGQPAMGQPAMGQPAMGQPAMGQPAMGQPAMGQPAMGQPAMGQPAMGQPAMGQPAMGQPAMGQPAMGQPAMGQPAMGGMVPGVPAQQPGVPGQVAFPGVGMPGMPGQ